MAEEIPYSLKPLNSEEPLPHSWGFTGSATASYPNGDTYTGDFLDGRKHGPGIYTYANGDVYDGVYENDLRHGLGRFTNGSTEEEAAPSTGKSFYSGYYELGLRHGNGTFQYTNGDIYSGQWNKGKKHGEGMYVFNSSKYNYTGSWNNGEIMSGKWVFLESKANSKGFYYDGQFQNNKPAGNGEFVRCGFEGYGTGNDVSEKKVANPGYSIKGCYTQEFLPTDTGVKVIMDWKNLELSRRTAC